MPSEKTRAADDQDFHFLFPFRHCEGSSPKQSPLFRRLLRAKEHRPRNDIIFFYFFDLVSIASVAFASSLCQPVVKRNGAGRGLSLRKSWLIPTFRFL
jgi:hypothetical protein